MPPMPRTWSIDAVGGKCLQAAAQPVFDVLGTLDQALAADDLEVLQAGRARGWMTGVGEAMEEDELGIGLRAPRLGRCPTNTPPSGM